MTGLLATSGAGLMLASVTVLSGPGAFLWAPGLALVLWAVKRHQDRHQRHAQRRRAARRGFIA